MDLIQQYSSWSSADSQTRSQKHQGDSPTGNNNENEQSKQDELNSSMEILSLQSEELANEVTAVNNNGEYLENSSQGCSNVSKVDHASKKSASSLELEPNTGTQSQNVNTSDSNQQIDSSSSNNVVMASQIQSDQTSSQSTFCSSQRASGLKKKKLSKKEKRKRRRNSGKAYISSNGQVVKKRECLRLTDCKAQCSTKISREDQLRIFKAYWAQGSYLRRLCFAKGLISLQPKRRSRGLNKKMRQFSATYYWKQEAFRIKVCRKCFKLTLGETDSFIQNLLVKSWTTIEAEPDRDKRGCQPPANKTPETKIAEVKKHIESFPAYESHYSRSHTSKKYLPIGLSLTKMYELYASSVEQPVKNEIYCRIFRETGLKFKQPHLDRCHRCDVYQAQLTYETDESKLACIRELQQQHYDTADSSFKEKAKDKKKAKQSNGKKNLCTFDLQQCLPTPSLHTSVSFYKRQLWTFNLTVNNSTSAETTCYMWHEGEARRGANEIASCLNAYLRTLSPAVEEAIFYSDSCGDQNKNKAVCAMFSVVVTNHETLQILDYKFLEPGHTRMECDSDHASIERVKKSCATEIQHPEDWYELVRNCNKKVVVMTQESFYDYEKLYKNFFIVRQKITNKERFLWHPVKWLRYGKMKGVILYKTSLQEDAEFLVLDLRRQPNMLACEIRLRYNAPVEISAEKKQDLLSFLEVLRPGVRSFYENLHDGQNEEKKDDPDLNLIEENEREWAEEIESATKKIVKRKKPAPKKKSEKQSNTQPPKELNPQQIKAEPRRELPPRKSRRIAQINIANHNEDFDEN